MTNNANNIIMFMNIQANNCLYKTLAQQAIIRKFKLLHGVNSYNKS